MPHARIIIGIPGFVDERSTPSLTPALPDTSPDCPMGVAMPTPDLPRGGHSGAQAADSVLTGSRR